MTNPQSSPRSTPPALRWAALAVMCVLLVAYLASSANRWPYALSGEHLGDVIITLLLLIGTVQAALAATARS